MRKARRMIYQSEILCMLDSLGVSCWLFDKPELTVQNKTKSLQRMIVFIIRALNLRV